MRGDVPVGRRARRDKEIDLEKALEDAEFKKSLLNIRSTEDSEKQSSDEDGIYVCGNGHILTGYQKDDRYIFFLYNEKKERIGHLNVGIGSQPVLKKAYGTENMFLIFKYRIKRELSKIYTEEQIDKFFSTLRRAV